MKKRYLKLVSVLTAVSIMAVTCVGAFAASDDQQQISGESEKSALVLKADQYVVFDAEKNKFTLKDEAKKQLSKEEIKDVKDLISTSNTTIDQIKNDTTVSITKTDKGLKITGNLNSGDVSIQTINTSSYWDWEILWWGYRFFFSNSLVSDMKDWKSTITGAGGVISGLGLRAWLIKIGVSATPAGIVASLFGLAVTWNIERIINADTGKGTYIDNFYWGGILSFNIYAA